MNGHAARAQWRIRRAPLGPGTERWQPVDGAGQGISAQQVFALWKRDERFRAFWRESLRTVSFEAYCWECPPVRTQDAGGVFECVFVSSPLLSPMPPDPGPFEEYFKEGCRAVSFESLGHDALLVAPCPGEPGTDFAHLARFVATAPEEQQSALWASVGAAVEGRLSDRPLWLSTAGLGVSWLHIRLDSRPKYYRHVPYT